MTRKEERALNEEIQGRLRKPRNPDAEDLLSQARIEDLTDELIAARMMKEGQEITSENFTKTRALVLEEFSTGQAPSALGMARARAKQNVLQRIQWQEISSDKAEGLLYQAAKTRKGSIKEKRLYTTDTNGKIQNDICTREQAWEEDLLPTTSNPEVYAAQRVALASLPAEKRAWLAAYEEGKLPAAATKAEKKRRDSKAHYWRQKLKKAVENKRNLTVPV